MAVTTMAAPGSLGPFHYHRHHCRMLSLDFGYNLHLLNEAFHQTKMNMTGTPMATPRFVGLS